MDQDTPTWLKIMQNGSIGEARAKAFLIDRFWILERSVDIDGADFIIQRKVTSSNLLDRNAPRFGVVQVKFYSSSATTQFIPKIYILDKENLTRDEFFVLCHTGEGDQQATYFLTAKDVHLNFELCIKNKVEKYKLKGGSVLKNKYKVDSNKNTLDRIENQLKLADFEKNREFISWSLPSANIDISAISTVYSEPIPNWWGEIPEEFKNLKEKCKTAINNIEWAHSQFKEIIEETDPIKALDFIEDIESDYKDGHGNWSISLPKDIFDEDFYYACKNHKEKVNYLKEKGILDKYIALKTVLKDNISEYICNNLPIDSNTILSVIIDYTKELDLNFSDYQLTRADRYFSIPNEVKKFGYIEVEMDKYSGIKPISDGKFELFWLVGRISKPEGNKTKICKFYKQNEFRIYIECMDFIYERLPE